jgi:hypothetical protein
MVAPVQIKDNETLFEDRNKLKAAINADKYHFVYSIDE